jgi:hypothetical protein
MIAQTSVRAHEGHGRSADHRREPSGANPEGPAAFHKAALDKWWQTNKAAGIKAN